MGVKGSLSFEVNECFVDETAAVFMHVEKIQADSRADGAIVHIQPAMNQGILLRFKDYANALQRQDLNSDKIKNPVQALQNLAETSGYETYRQDLGEELVKLLGLERG